ncbi:HAMP domain-containing sensor histidine kinase [Lysinibacillus sp. 54212]|uniref:HAMP domain-containing sensor histidine kinase n=1 Tax=Lysinibacillus sp. 54212 TaxID=3119829 RepID=UPI002FC76B6C
MNSSIGPLFNEFFMSINDCTIIVHSSLKIAFVNDKARKMLDLGDRNTEFLEVDEPSLPIWQSFIDRIRQQTCGSCELRIKTSRTSTKLVKFMGYYSERDDIVFARLVIQKETAISAFSSINYQNFSTMLNHVEQGILITTNEGIVVDMNRQAAQFINCGENEYIDSHFKQIIKHFSFNTTELSDFYNILKSYKSSSINFEKTDVCGNRSYYHIKTSYDMGMNVFITVITDETEKILLQKEREKQSYLQDLGQMAASIAHEIRNPMTSLKGFIDLLKMSVKDEHTNYFSIIDSELQRMDTILSDLLYLAKPKVETYDPICLIGVVNSVIDLMQYTAVTQNIILQHEYNVMDNFTIFGNRVRLQQVLINLVKNAMEAMPSGGVIQIKLISTSEGSLQLKIRDQGGGMHEETKRNLFQPFYSTKDTGTGLGLPLVKKIVEEHNGQIDLDSVVGEGTKFTISFPIVPMDGVISNENSNSETYVI